MITTSIFLSMIFLTQPINSGQVNQQNRKCNHCKTSLCNNRYVSESEFIYIFNKVAPSFGHSSRNAFNRTRWIAQRESGVGRVRGEFRLDSRIQNRNSSAYGMFQFLNSTWRNVGVQKTNCKFKQMRAFFLYIQRRYNGSLDRAYRHHKQHGYY